MTHRQGVARDRDIAARWCALAEQRLEHLTEMFETGRWRRYHSEIAFLENIQEAKRAVETWRALATGEDVSVASAIGTSALGWSPARVSHGPTLRPHAQTVQPKTVQPKTVQFKTVQPKTVQPKAVHINAQAWVPVEFDATLDRLAEVTEAPIVPAAEPPPATPERAPPPPRVSEFTLSLDGIEARYPLLRNAF
jgi:uncharacterized repeat protein (TIGR03809 family)